MAPPPTGASAFLEGYDREQDSPTWCHPAEIRGRRSDLILPRQYNVPESVAHTGHSLLNMQLAVPTRSGY